MLQYKLVAECLSFASSLCHITVQRVALLASLLAASHAVPAQHLAWMAGPPCWRFHHWRAPSAAGDCTALCPWHPSSLPLLFYCWSQPTRCSGTATSQPRQYSAPVLIIIRNQNSFQHIALRRASPWSTHCSCMKDPQSAETYCHRTVHVHVESQTATTKPTICRPSKLRAWSFLWAQRVLVFPCWCNIEMQHMLRHCNYIIK